MAEKTWTCTREQSIADFGGGSNRGNGKDDHAPIGLYGGVVFRELLDFAYDWTKVYQIKKAYLELRTTGEVHIARGASPRVKVARITTSWREDGGAENSWSTSAATVYGGPSTTGTVVDSSVLSTGSDKLDRIDITAIVDAWAPSTVRRSNGQAGTATASDRRGLRVISYDEASTSRTTEFFSRRIDSAWKRPRIVLVYDDNAPPEAPDVQSPEPGGSPTQVATTSGKEVTVTFDFNDSDDNVCSRVELEVYPNAITDATASSSNRSATTGVIAPTGTGTARRYTVRITGLSARTDQRYRLRVMDPKGAWSPWTSLADGRIKTAYIPGVPLQPQMETTPDQPTIYGTINSPDTGDYVTGWQGEFYRYNPDGTRTTLWAPGVQDIGGTSTRSAVEYAGTTLNDGDKVYWRHRHVNRDGVGGTWSPFYVTTIKTQVGPTITPADASTKLTSRTASITLGFNGVSTTGYQYRLYRGGLSVENPPLVHDSNLVTISAATSASFTLPSGKVNWGDLLTIEAASAPAAGGGLGPFSPRSELYVNALPGGPTLTPTDEDGNTGDTIPTTNVLWSAPYSDQDRLIYGDDPVASEIEIREAASPPGSGTLGYWKTHAVTGQIPEDEETGETIDLLTSATGYSADANVTATTENQQPSGYSGNSLSIQATGGSSTDRGATLTFSSALDLSGYGAQHFFRINRRCTSVTNLVRWNIRFIFASGSDYAEHQLFAAADTINTWSEVYPFKGNPLATAGTVDWSNVTAIRFWADVSGAYTGNLQVRDLRVGTTANNKSTPDGGLVAESSYDVRRRYRDDADALISTTLAATWSSGTNVKLTSVTGLEVGMDLTVGADESYLQETRRITAVGTSGAGGTGVDISEAFVISKSSGLAARVFPWGAWSEWKTVKVSLPPTVAADTPANLASIVDPTRSFAHTYSSPGSKAQASRDLDIYKRTGYQNRALASSPASYWRLSETSSTYADSVGSATGTNNGTTTRGVTGALDPGDTDAAVTLDGSTGYITFGDTHGYGGTTGFAAAAWVKMNAAQSGRLFSKEGASSLNGWYVRITANGAVVFARADGSTTDSIITADGLITTGEWHHVLVNYYSAGPTIYIYMDGVLEAIGDSTVSMGTNANNLTIGRQANGSASFLHGTVDEAAVWSRTLAAGEPRALYAGRLEQPTDALVYTLSTDGTGLTDTLPTLLLEDAQSYAWDKTAYDTDGLSGTTTRRSFITAFTAPAVIADLVATADDESGSVTLTWTASADTYFDHHRVYWRDLAGQLVRIDGGPEEVDDGRTKLTAGTLTWYGGRLGENEFVVTAHNGSLESDPTTVSATLARTVGEWGQWMIVADGEERYTFGLPVVDAPRSHTGVVETFRVPGRATPVHLHWGRTGRHTSLSLRYRPADHGDLLTPLTELHETGQAVWLKAPAGYLWDVMRARIVDLSDAVAPYGWTGVTVEVDEVDPDD